MLSGIGRCPVHSVWAAQDRIISPLVLAHFDVNTTTSLCQQLLELAPVNSHMNSKYHAATWCTGLDSDLERFVLIVLHLRYSVSRRSRRSRHQVLLNLYGFWQDLGASYSWLVSFSLHPLFIVTWLWPSTTSVNDFTTHLPHYISQKTCSTILRGQWFKLIVIFLVHKSYLLEMSICCPITKLLLGPEWFQIVNQPTRRNNNLDRIYATDI